MNKKVLAVLLSLTMICPAAGFSVYAENDEPAEIAEEELLLSSDEMSLMAESGICGDNVTYTLNDSGVLTISGTGAMWDYYSSPFISKSSEIKSVIIKDGVTSIGNCAFS